MNDLISRQAVIDLFKKYQLRMATSVIEFGNALKGLPVIEAEPKWIPVTEKLPPYMEEVLATTAYGDLMIMARYPGYNGDTNPYIWTSVATAFDYEADEVKAWMPLPEPYKAKEEE